LHPIYFGSDALLEALFCFAQAKAQSLMTLSDRLGIVFGWKAVDTTGVRPSMPSGSWGQFINGFEAFRHLFRSTPKIDPADANAGDDNSIVSITINWMATSWGMMPPQVGQSDGATFTPLARPHPYLAILEQPNPYYDGLDLNISLLHDYLKRGNAYELLVRNRRDEVIESYWLPANLVRPIPDASGYLSHYEYTPGRTERLEIEDVVHHRFRVDPANPLQGVSPLAEQYREIVTDNSYSDYGAGLAKEGGVPPIMFAPRIVRDSTGTATVTMKPEAAKSLTERLRDRLSRSPGKPFFVPGSVEMHQMGFKPDEMALLDTRAMPECRIPAALGIHPVTIGLYTGFLHANYANSVEFNKQSMRNGLLPIVRRFEVARTKRALRSFPGSERLTLRYDTSQIPELQESYTERRKEAREDLAAGVITIEEAREEGGRSVDPKVLADLSARGEVGRDSKDIASLVSAVGTLIRSGFDPQASLAAVGLDAISHTGLLPVTVQEDGTVKSLKRVSLDSSASSFRAALLAREDKAVAAMRASLDSIASSIEEKLEALVADMEAAILAGEVVTEGWMLRAQSYVDLLAEIEAQYSSLGESEAEGIQAAQQDAVTLATRAAETMTRARLGTPPSGATIPAWRELPADVIEAFVGRAQDGTALADLLASLGPDAAKATREAILVGIAEGQGPKDVARTIRSVAGMSRRRAETIARTEMHQAAREATRLSYEENSDVVAGYVRLSAGDSRTCAACFALHGKKSQVSEIMPTHPCCRCVLAPDVKSWNEILGRDDIEQDATEIEDGETIFGRLSEADQRAVLGAGMYEAWARGDVPFSAMAVETNDERWGPGIRTATLQEVMAR
jgi:HK97 family phage portal protein